MEMNELIGCYRKKLGLTQETLAQKLGVTNQAVSKWESGQNYPDVQLLPLLADVFEISLDQLFGRPAPEETPSRTRSLPWEDDNTLHAALYVGHTLVGESKVDRFPEAKQLSFAYEGPALNVDSHFSVTCGAVEGNVNTGGSVNCGNVAGNVKAGTSVNCGDVSGNVGAGLGVTCQNIGGDVKAGGNVTAATIEGKRG